MDAKDAMISLLAQHGIVPKHYVRGTAIAYMDRTQETEGAMQQRFADQHKEQLERSIEQKLERAEFELTQLFSHIRALVRQIKKGVIHD